MGLGNYKMNKELRDLLMVNCSEHNSLLQDKFEEMDMKIHNLSAMIYRMQYMFHLIDEHEIWEVIEKFRGDMGIKKILGNFTKKDFHEKYSLLGKWKKEVLSEKVMDVLNRSIREAKVFADSLDVESGHLEVNPIRQDQDALEQIKNILIQNGLILNKPIEDSLRDEFKKLCVDKE